MADGRSDGLAALRPLHPASGWTRAATRLVLPYPPLLLVAASPFGGLERALVSCGLAIIYVALVLGTWRPGRLLAALASWLTVPVILYPVAGYAALLFAAPVLPLVFQGLERCAVPGRSAPATPVPTSLASRLLSALAAIALFAAFAGSGALLAACGILGLVLGCVGLASGSRLRRMRIAAGSERLTVVAGTHVRAAVRLDVSGRLRGRVRVSDAGVASGVTPEVFPVGSGPVVLDVDVTPTLGGLAEVTLGLVFVDRWSLATVARRVMVLSLAVVPRARAAEKVARLFLEGSGSERGLAGADLSDAVLRFLVNVRGAEYQSSRLYVPGDTLQDVDWKHTARLQRLTSKVLTDESSTSGIIAVGLEVSDADEADRLAYELLSAVLAAVRMSFLASIVSYSRLDGNATERLGDRALVRKALGLVQHIAISPSPRRVLSTRGVHQVVLARSQLNGAPGEAAARLRGLLGLEEEEVRRAVESSPLTGALRRAGGRSAGGWLVCISTMGYDAEAVATHVRAMERRGVRTLLVNAGASSR